MKDCCKLDRVTLSEDMHIEGGRRGPEQMIVQGGNLDATLRQLGQHRGNFSFGEDQISHDGCRPSHLLEGKPRAES